VIGDLVKRTWRYSALFRGVLSAFGVLLIVDQALHWEREPFLALIHALLTHYHLVLSEWVRPLIGLLPNVPMPSSNAINLIVIAACTYPIILIQALDQRSSLIGKFAIVGFLCASVYYFGSLWNANEGDFESMSAPHKAGAWTGIAIIIPYTIIGMTRRRNTFISLYSWSLFLTITFFLTLEVLYLLPPIRELSQSFIGWTESLEKQYQYQYQ